ncbi:MAG TPA: hypothetical protein VF306_14475 [Pirellulales bacterium]
MHALAVTVLGSLTVPTTTDKTAGSLQLSANYTSDVSLGGAISPVDLTDVQPQLADPVPPLVEDAEPADQSNLPTEKPVESRSPPSDLAGNDGLAPAAAPAETEMTEAATPQADDKLSVAADTSPGEIEVPAAVAPASAIASTEKPREQASPPAIDARAVSSSAAEQITAKNSVEKVVLPDDTPRPTSAEQQRYLDIVDRFIEADLGRLARTEADLAKHDFDRLNPAAIPSLVYGLNKSAKIHASCPVAVLTFKLDMALRKNRDPELLQYAIDHLGEGVADTAPHAKRLRALLEQWRSSDASGSLGPDRAETTVPPRRRRAR